MERSNHIATMTNKANSRLSFLCRNLNGCSDRFKQTAYFSLIRSFMESPLFGTRTKSTTVRACSVELKGSLTVGIQDTLVFMICLMCWVCCLILFYQIINGLAKCPSNASLLRRIRVLEEITRSGSIDSRLHAVEPPRSRSFIWQIGVNSSIQDQRQF